MKFKLFKYLIINLIICCTKICLADDILGCGGFIKSHADIDFSKVEVKLFTKQGSLKDKTDCSPSNGYYFLPVYDKGEYLLKISPPPGWSFQPDQVAINFDGKTDVCSQGKDVNFVFKGFGITGVIKIDGGDSENVGNIGGKGVNVELKSENGNDIRNTISDMNGIFFFSPVIPGKYTIKCSRPNWHFAVDEREVIVNTGNTELPKDSFIVDGFDVYGKILNDGQSIGNIGFVLLEKKGQKSQIKCKSSKIISKMTITDPNFDSTPLCYSLPDIKTGEYKFDAVPPGIYLIVPHIENKNIHIRPESIEFFVNVNTVNIPTKFQIIGFSTSIRVLDSPNGKGIKDAEIKLNDKIVGQTGSNGVYTFDSIKTGTYTIQAIAEHYQFMDKTIQISIANSIIPDITANAFKVCGKVVSERSYTVTITKHASTFHVPIKSASGTGDWCYYLQNGKYNIQVLTDDADQAAGVQFFPAEQIIDVISSPISNIIFSQLRAIVSGEVRCLNDAGSNCLEITVTLTSLDVNGHSTGPPILTALQSGTKYRFTDVLPGSYEVHVPNTVLCWQSNAFRITVKEATETIPPFIHTGYLVSVISSHTVKMNYKLRGSPAPSQQQQQQQPPQQQNTNLISEIQLTTGLNTFCVKESGHYDINFIGCHMYDGRTVPKQFFTGDKHPITVTAEQHKNGIQILSNEQHSHSKYEMIIESTNRLKQTLYATEGSSKINDYYVYRLSIDLRPDEVVRVIPQSGYMLFKPEYKEIRGGVDCVETAFTFTATKGLIIAGQTEPAIKDVEITVSFPNNSDMEDVRLLTDSNGSFRFGPIDGSLAVNLVAYKESYVFSEYDKQTNTFKAHKLCEIIGNVKDEDGNQLVGVLLSLSGAESYRKNLVTGEDGTIKFHSLSPSQYFLRPMMKEYKFEPQSKIIDVVDGQTIEVLLIGRRIAYSVFGTINSLNGEPFSNVIVEAISNEQCQWHQEEATTESTGNYRIRGLQSNCEYTVRVKQATGKDVNVLIDRTIPVERQITVENVDIKNINLIGISPLPSVDVIARVYASNIDYYKILQIKLNRKGGDSSGPVHTQLIETPMANAKSVINPGYMVFFPRIPFDKKTYVIELETLSSARNYQYQMLSQSFVANRSTIYIEFNFTPEIRSNDNELNQNSISALILVGLVAIAFFRQDLAMEFINFVWTHLNSMINGLMNKQKNGGGGFGGFGGFGGGNNNNSGGGGGGGSNNSNKNKKYDIDENEIEKLAQSINATKRKNVRKVN